MQSPTIGKLATALIKVQAEMKPVPRNAENPFFQSGYADLAGCINHASPLLTKNGLAIIQTSIPSTDGKLTMKTSLVHESGEWIDGEMAVTPTKQDPQGAGSAVTYMRRYGYCAIIGLAQEGEDDDGERAQGRAAQNRPERAEPRPEPFKLGKPPQDAPRAKEQASNGLQRAEVVFEDYKRVDSKPPGKWTAWFCKFTTDSGAELEVGTFDGKIAESLDPLLGTPVEITYRPSKNKPDKMELCTIGPIDNVP